MKNVLALIALCVTVSFQTTQAQDFPDMDKSPMDIAMLRGDNNQALIRVIYSRPQKKDREIFGKLVPYGKIWRTGANEATEITFYVDMMLNDSKIEAGTYSLYTIPGEKEWTVILNKTTNRWGTSGYSQEQDAVRINAPARTSPATIESFSIAFKPTDNGAHLMMGWDDTFIQVPFKKA
ncbi:hypothetical protein GCM10009117_26180 [Gangjinia marincola]|uniref:DUF2911 domain-containing protein n=1 Tax=Gangjinia marincola TaxID=578463 RepID=A0ABN1MJQ0_9FLAO